MLKAVALCFPAVAQAASLIVGVRPVQAVRESCHDDYDKNRAVVLSIGTITIITTLYFSFKNSAWGDSRVDKLGH